MERWGRLLVGLLLLGVSGACSVRSASKSAATGAIEALGRSGEEAAFRNKVEKLADHLIDKALEDPAPVPGPREIGREMAAGMLEGLHVYLAEVSRDSERGTGGAGPAGELTPLFASEMRQLAPTTRLLLAESGRGLVDGLASRREDIAALMADVAAETGRALVHAITEQLQAELRQQLQQPPDPALAQAVERMAAAGVRGVTNELGRTGPACENGPCMPEVASQLSHSAVRGAALGLLPLLLVGLGAFLAGALVVFLLTRRPSHRVG